MSLHIDIDEPRECRMLPQPSANEPHINPPSRTERIAAFVLALLWRGLKREA